jgi:hypothetical protein
MRGTHTIPSGLKKDWKALALAMRAAGWTFEEGTKHGRAFAPDGVTWASLPTTPSDYRALKNATAAFRRWCRVHGIDPGI